MAGDDSSPIFDVQRERLGTERLERFVQGHAALQAMALFLVMSVNTVPQVGYTDEAIECLIQDARDVRQAAATWARDCEELAQHWRAQRQERG